jgi:hypothetical protein
MPEYNVNLGWSAMKRQQGGRVVASSHSQSAEAWAWRNQISELTTSLKSALVTHNYNDFNDRFKKVDLSSEVSKVFVLDQVDTAISEWRESELLLPNDHDVGVDQFLSNIRQLGLTDFEFDTFIEIDAEAIILSMRAEEAAAIQDREAAARPSWKKMSYDAQHPVFDACGHLSSQEPVRVYNENPSFTAYGDAEL